MIAGKEHYIYFENLAKLQERIYPDACDTGVLIKDLHDKTLIGKAIAGLKKIYKFGEETWGSRYYTHGKSVIFHVPFEFDEGRYVGVTLRVSYHIVKKPKSEFISIDISRWTSPDSPFKNN